MFAAAMSPARFVTRFELSRLVFLPTANVGRLAALTGGQIIVARDAADAADAMRAAITSVRRPKPENGIAQWPLSRASLHAGGATIEATWRDATLESSEFGKAVGALAAAIALPRLTEAQATEVAASHGLVCHLTSLVLVDEAGEVQEGLPAQRKVPLMAMPAAGAALSEPYIPAFCRMPPPQFRDQAGPFVSERRSRRLRDFLRPDLDTIARKIDWGKDPEALRQGDLSALPRRCAQIILQVAKAAEVQVLVWSDLNATVIVIGLLARSVAVNNRAADRISRAILTGSDEVLVARAAGAVGL